jgi:exoribonuclease R
MKTLEEGIPVVSNDNAFGRNADSGDYSHVAHPLRRFPDCSL